MANIFNTSPHLTLHETQVVKTRTTPEGRIAVAVEENIIRPAGGGQPQDLGFITTDGVAVPVGKLFKADGETWLEVDGTVAGPLAHGTPVTLSLDAPRRHSLSRCHSLTHLGMAVVKTLLPGYESKGAEISESAADLTLFFRGDRTPDGAMLRDLDSQMRSLIFQAVPITVERAKSMKAAELTYPKWRVDPDNQLTGRIRIIHIQGVDANPCSGSHVMSTSQIGPFEIRGCRVDGRGVTALSMRRLDVWMSW